MTGSIRLAPVLALMCLGEIPAGAANARPAFPLAPVAIQGGRVHGAAGRDSSVTAWRGIPFAAPPVGRLRWRPPAPPAPWPGVRRADAFGAWCPQPAPENGPAPPMSEDCLTLNVWSAARSPAERRPVLVWIYGGGFIGGTGANSEFDGEGLARKGVVVVTFNYRSGVLGFLATPQLSAESGHRASGNYGLLDQIAALRWVQRNIASFGGDPARVTIAGQSAGAGSVGFLTFSPLARGLFTRSIAQSHARYPRDPELRYLSVSWRPLHGAEQAGLAYARTHGVTTLAELRAMPWQRLIVGSNTIDADVETGSTARPPLFRPVVDGWVVPRSYSQSFTAGTQNDVVFVTGNNRDESGAVPETAFERLRTQTAPPRAGMPQTSVTLAGFTSAARAKFGPMADEFLRLYPASNDQEASLAANDAVRDNSRISTFLWAGLWSRHATRPVFTYFWTHRPPGAQHDMRGAYHGSEILYVLNNLGAADRPYSYEDRRIAEIMSSYWVNIIASGNPNGTGLPEWPVFDPASPTIMEVGDRFGPMPVANPARLDFWRRFFATQEAW